MRNTIVKDLIRLSLVLLLVIGGAGSGLPRKYARYVEKGDRLYHNFIYIKAIEFYKKALDSDEGEADYPTLKVADCYRLINDHEQANIWYARVEHSEIMTDQDRAHYAQELLKTGNYAKAQVMVEKLNLDDAGLERLSEIHNTETFYLDSLAYAVEDVNFNSAEADFSPAFYKEGIVFSSNRKSSRLFQSTYFWDESYFLDLYYSNQSSAEEAKPKPLSKKINTIFHEGPAAFYEDGNKVIFTRNNFNLGKKRTSVEGVNMLKLFYAERKSENHNWSKPVELPFNSDEYSVGHPALSADGKTLYFSSDMPGTVGQADIFKSELKDGEWTKPESLGDIVNTVADELFPYIQDDHILYFASAGHPGIGGLDIYKVDLRSPNPSVVNLGYPINTKEDDFGLIVDENEGYFSSNRKGGVGGDDIYKFKVQHFNVTATLIDELSKDRLLGDIAVKDETTGALVSNVTSLTHVTFKGIRGHQYSIMGSSVDYHPNQLALATESIDEEVRDYRLDIPLKPMPRFADFVVVNNYGGESQVFLSEGEIKPLDLEIEKIETYCMDNNRVLRDRVDIKSIYYDFDKSNIRSDAREELDKLVDVLKNNEGAKVELSSHTDSRGSSSYNKKLSERRAQSAKAYLVENNISEDRVKIIHYGEDRLINECLDNKKCAENSHQLNRRTEIKIVSKS